MTLITAATIALPARAPGRGWLETTGDRIEAVGLGEPDRAADLDLANATLVPGFVDMHVHGGGGGAYTGVHEEISQALLFHRRHGTTTSLASLVSASPGDLRRSVRVLADFVDRDLLGGIHLEGPWLSPARAGAHDPQQLRLPDPLEINHLLSDGRGTIRMITVAPELQGGLDAIRRIVGAGVVAAVGHTDADYALVQTAIGAGARVGTHLFNAMRAVHHREPGPVLALLEDDRTVVELVTDGIHVHPALQRLVITNVGPSRVALVTDAMAAAGMPDGTYRLGGLHVSVEDGHARLPHTGTIAGSTATMDALFRQAVSASDRPWAAALAAAVEMTATTPSRALGLDQVGALEPGRRADLVVLGSDLRVARVMRNGRWEPRPDDLLSPAPS